MSLGNRLYAELRGDRVIWTILALLAIISILLVYSSTEALAYRNQGGNTEFYLFKHIIILSFGLLITYACFLLHYEKYKIAAPYLLLLSIPLLLYTLLAGVDVNEAKRWIEVPFVGITFQSSDFAELALVIFVAREITKKQDDIKDFQSGFVPILSAIIVICGLIAPADLSTAAVLFFTCLLMMFMGRVPVKFIGTVLFCGLVVFAFIYMLGDVFPDIFGRAKTWSSRIQEFRADGDPYQVEQAKIAIANGEFFGLGPGNSLQRHMLPQAYSDFIYAIILEEYGLIGGFFVMFLYIMLFVRTAKLITKSSKTFGAMLAMGLSSMLIIQALMNMAVAVDLLPVTGLTLPMISLGGTSLLFTCVAFGMILSVSKYVETQTQEA
ncbi:MAG: FtsW/RodA/SpoVE family cell cycle protein [Bacteroidota bacterium]